MLRTSLLQLSLPFLRHNPIIGLQLFWLAKYGCVTGTVLVLCTGHFILHTIYYVILFVALFRSLFLICFYLCRNTSSHELIFLFDTSTVNKDSCILYRCLGVEVGGAPRSGEAWRGVARHGAGITVDTRL